MNDSCPQPHEIVHSFRSIGGERLRIAATHPPGAGVAPLLIFNGIGASTELLEPLKRRLTGVATITFDLPGVGASQPSILIRRLPGYSQLTRELHDDPGIEKAHVMDISWGGGLAQHFTRQYPDRVERLVLAATSTGHLMVPPRPSVILRPRVPSHRAHWPADRAYARCRTTARRRARRARSRSAP